MGYSEEKSKAMVFEVFTAFVITLAILPIINGFVIKIMWPWFITPLGIDSISIAHAIGLTAISTFFHSKKDEARSDKLWENVLDVFARPVILFLFGYVVQLFM